ncbi:M13 family metallopeptidase [Arenimonas fontis]|uniref:M13 family metallopeptidase n=1 Tax=Arenimonas fontis TaxID=2608255 RepID=A0A5B2ZDW7_9GAMM|nr:M13 family metallopeptidase [Arenimonas fontis]KAA2285823.1 M13 family metallopeptidase [Arenimonas fontis]
MFPSKSKPLALAVAISLGLGACQPASEAPEAPARPKLVVDLSAVTLQPISLRAEDLDPSVEACRDFNGFVNSKWLAANPVPGDRTTWGAFALLGERSLEVQHQIARAAAAGQWPAGSMEQKVGDFFAAGMDEAAVEAAGLAPIQAELDGIAAIASNANIPAYLGEAYARGQGMLFPFFAMADYNDSSVNIAYAIQGGLSLPERGYYIEDREDFARIREAFKQHVARVLTLAGADEATASTQAEQVLAFETRLAQASLGRVEMRDPARRYRPVTLAEADASTPNFSWTAFFAALDVPAPEKFSLATPEFFAEMDEMLAEVPLEQWQTWLRFRTIDGASPYLSSAFEQANFDFYRKTLAGQQEMQPRWKRVLTALNMSMGEGFGQLYVEQAFPPESKAKMEQLVGNLREALRARIENLEWMGEETKARALEKWSTFTPKIGYPDKWRDWSGLRIGRDSYAGNVMAAAAFNYRWNLDKIGKPVDRSEWGMSPQTVNAYYRATANEIVFPAAILQPPFFDPDADDALNYGGIGAVIGHEMLHGFDDQGSKFDAAGNMANWWTEEDRRRFEARADKLAEQFSGYEALPGLFVNGRLGLGENIADLGGVTVAYDAMKRAQGERFSDPMVEGFSQDQRFFMNWATVWRIAFTEAQLRQQLQVGPHSPGMFRAIGAPSNLPAFAEAFGCKEGDPMVRSGEQRVVIW